jgi:hypothetical protein
LRRNKDCAKLSLCLWQRLKMSKEVVRVISWVRARDAKDHEAACIRNYELANLLTFAQHDPKKMPGYKPVSAKPEAASDAVQQAKARGAMISWALQNGA